LHIAMQTRATIEQAKGVVMALHGCSPDEAFARLARLSQVLQSKLHDVAASIVSDVSSGQAGARTVMELTSRVAPDVGSER
jgi:AmiR/NasT family two-component response regulator